MAIVPVMSLLQIVWISLSRVLILLKCHHFGISRFNREIRLEFSLMPRSFSFAALKCLQSGNMDSRVFMEPLNPCL